MTGSPERSSGLGVTPVAGRRSLGRLVGWSVRRGGCSGVGWWGWFTGSAAVSVLVELVGVKAPSGSEQVPTRDSHQLDQKGRSYADPAEGSEPSTGVVGRSGWAVATGSPSAPTELARGGAGSVCRWGPGEFCRSGRWAADGRAYLSRPGSAYRAVRAGLCMRPRPGNSRRDGPARVPSGNGRLPGARTRATLPNRGKVADLACRARLGEDRGAVRGCDPPQAGWVGPVRGADGLFDHRPLASGYRSNNRVSGLESGSVDGWWTR